MNRLQFEDLLTRYEQGLASKEEVVLLEHWFAQESAPDPEDVLSARQPEIYKEMWLAIFQATTAAPLRQVPERKTYEPVKRAKLPIKPAELPIKHAKLPVEPAKLSIERAKLYYKIVAIAAAVATITLGVWLYYTSSMNGRHLEGSTATRDLSTNDIAPGRNTATLTLASGEVINLSDQKTGVVIDPNSLKYSDGTSISSSLRGKRSDDPSSSRELRSKPISSGTEIYTASTPRGGTYQITLPDGTKVWLNADTKIEFPSQFIGKERKVLLSSGEAYFEVGHNKLKPFIVESKGQEVTVLGTHFNISAYPDEGGTKTTLLEGSVSVSSLRGIEAISQGAAVKLKPNQQSVLTDNKIQVNPINPEDAIAWKQGYFKFTDDENIRSIMKRVARWYDVEVTFIGKMDEVNFTGTVSKFKNISVLLQKLEQTGMVTFKVEGRKVTAIAK